MTDKKIFIAGNNGMVGRAVWRKLEESGYKNLIGRSSKELDLRDQTQVKYFFEKEKPEIVVDAAARVGGIMANNNYPYNFIMENMQIQNNLIENSFTSDVQKFIFLGSSCIYPKMAPQPISEKSLLTGDLEPTNQWYAIAKISGVKSCEAIRNQFGRDFVSLMPTNLFGTYDNFDLETSHVLPAMLRKFHEARINGNMPVTLWGSGKPMREFLYVDDLADAVKFAVENKMEDNLYNIGTGTDLTINDLALLIQRVTGHTGDIHWDSSKPDGTPRKLLDVSKMKASGWVAQTSLEEGLNKTYEWFLNQKEIKTLQISK